MSGIVLPFQSLFDIPLPPSQLGPFRVPGWEVQPPQPPAWPPVKNRAVATKGRADFGIYTKFVPLGWEVQPVQPPQRKPPPAGAITYKSGFSFSSTTAITLNFYPESTGVNQPPHPRREKSAAIVSHDDGIVARFIVPFQEGWAIQPPQPPRPVIFRFAAIAPIDQGNEAKYIAPIAPTSIPWAIDTNLMMRQTRPRLSATKGRAEFGVFSVKFGLSGWEIQSWQPPAPINKPTRVLVTKHRTGFTFITVPFINGWEQIQTQPFHTRYEKAGAFAGPIFIDAKISFPIIPITNGQTTGDFPMPRYRRMQGGFLQSVFTIDEGFAVSAGATGIPWTHDYVPILPKRPYRINAIKGKTSFARFYQWQNPGFEPQLPNPVHPRPERSGATAIGESGIEATFTPTLISQPVWSSALDLTPRNYIRTRSQAIVGRSQFSVFPYVTLGFEVQPWQPPHPKPERAVAIFYKSGFSYPTGAPQFPSIAWEAPAALKYQTFSRGHGAYGKSQFSYFPWPNAGWEVQPWQPPSAPKLLSREPVTRGRAEFALPDTWVNGGWAIQDHQPQHPRYEKASALIGGDPGHWATRNILFVDGWQILDFLPPHPRREKAGSIVAHDDGNYSAYVFVPPALVRGYDPVLPTLVRPINFRFAGAQGRNQFSAYPIFTPFSWEIQPPIIPHLRSEKGGLLPFSDEGAFPPFVFVPPPGSIQVPGAGKRWPPSPGPYPPYDVEPNKERKRVKPIWDREPEIKPDPIGPPKPPELPPVAIFREEKLPPILLRGLPKFDNFKMPQAMALGDQLKQAIAQTAQDADDEEALMKILSDLEE